MPDITAVALGIASTAVSALGILMFKLASRLDFKDMLLNRHFILGGTMFLFGGLFLILALKTEELSLIFPLTSLTYIWVMCLSKAFLNESISKFKIASIALIVAGIIFVTAF